MADLLRRIAGIRGARATVVAITTLVLTVSVAFAAGPNGNHGKSGDHANKGNHGAQASAHPDSSEAPETESPDEDGAGGNGHGALVSAAAHMATPAGFANHGAFVSCVAHMHDVTLATIDWSSVTPSSCAAAKSGEDDH